MKIIAQTERGKFYIHEKEIVEDRFTLIADWHFFRGIIQPEEELNFDDLKKSNYYVNGLTFHHFLILNFRFPLVSFM